MSDQIRDQFGEDEILDASDPNFSAELAFRLATTGDSSDYRNDRQRPYNGQPHTDFGERGRTLIRGLTMRDLVDCFVIAFLRCVGDSQAELRAKVEAGTWRVSDLWKIDTSDIDPLAVAQNMTCEVEKMMGIYPNLKDKHFQDQEEATR